MRRLSIILVLAGLMAAWWPESARAGQRSKSIVRIAQANRVRKPRTPNLSALDRLRRMTPQQRRKALQKLSPERRRALQQRLRQLDKLSPEQQRKLRQEYRLFRQLPAERQARARQLYQRFNRLPAGRKSAVAQEFRRLRRLEPSQRTQRLESKRFEERFSADDQKLLREMVKTLPSQASGQ